MRRRILAGLVLLAGCSAAPSETKSAATNDASGNVVMGTPVAAEPGTKVREDRAGPAVPEPERTVSLPDSVEVARDASLPPRARVALALVRRGRLVREPEPILRLAHELASDARVASVSALEPFDGAARVGLDELARAASRQGAHVLVVDAREDEREATTFVLDATSRRFLAHVKARAPGPRDETLVARLVRSSRGTP